VKLQAQILPKVLFTSLAEWPACYRP